MKEPISEKAVAAINELNRVALIMARQMKSGELDKPVADKAIVSAQRKARVLHNAYFSRKEHFSLAASNEHLRQLTDFNESGMFDEFNTANTRFGKVLKHYAKAVEAEFKEN